MNNLLQATTRAQFRAWLTEHHATERECWVVAKRGRWSEGDPLRYLDAVEEALCFGWIDSTVKTLPTGESVQRFTPRRPRSAWSELNKERCRRLERLGLMTDAGRAALPDMTEQGFVIESDIREALQADSAVWDNFQQLPELYKRVRVDTIQIKRKHPALFRSRLAKFVEYTRRNELYGTWNDDGRLL